jgi:predicted dehydrogenase
MTIDPGDQGGSQTTKLAIVGLGKIARDQHLPAIAANAHFELVATADPTAALPNVAGFTSLSDLLARGPAVEAVAVCTPPRVRGAIIQEAIAAGLHVLMEKPPATTLAEVDLLRSLADERGITLFAAWHSREAGGVAPAREWLSDKTVTRLAIRWHEDIRRWHPGQDWILASGGFGVFDPGINALSIATAILPQPLIVTSASMTVPAERQSPLSAELELRSGDASGTASFDFLHEGEQLWDIEVDTDRGQLRLRMGGSVLQADGSEHRFADEEYPRLYARFADLIAQRQSDVDDAPSKLVADAFCLAERHSGAPFGW